MRNTTRPTNDRAGRAAGRVVQGAAAAVLLGMLWVTLDAAAVERQVQLAYHRAERDVGLDRAPPPAEAAPRAALAYALINGRRAAELPAGAQQARYLAAGWKYLDVAAAARRPGWGEIDVADTFLRTVEHGAGSREARDSYRRSYRNAPFLVAQSIWRIRFGSEAWASIDEPSRRMMLAEAAWAGSQSGWQYALVRSIIGRRGERLQRFRGASAAHMAERGDR